MATSTTTRKEIFTALGQVHVVDGVKKLVLKSPTYYQSQLNHLPTDKTIAITLAENVASRSRQQLAYYFVLVGYIADHCGYTREECHDVLMRTKFGTKKLRFMGKDVEVRKSVSDAARLPTHEMVELINYAKECCDELAIYVPTQEELGYLPC